MSPVDEEGTQKFPADTLLDLPPGTREFLQDLRPGEVEALRMIVQMGPDGVKGITESVKFWQSVATVSRFMKWIVIVFLGTIAAGLVIIREIAEGMEYVKGLFR